MPLCAMCILFDLVVHNPAHPETDTNLALLDKAVGYFSRLDYTSGGSIPTSMLSGFSHIAIQFVRDYRDTHGMMPPGQLALPETRPESTTNSSSHGDGTSIVCAPNTSQETWMPQPLDSQDMGTMPQVNFLSLGHSYPEHGEMPFFLQTLLQ